MLKEYSRKTNLGILFSFLFLGAGVSLGERNDLASLLILPAIGLWFYGLVAYARGKGQSAWHALAGIFYLLGLVYMFRLEDRYPSGTKPEEEAAPAEVPLAETPVKKPRYSLPALLIQISVGLVLGAALYIYVFKPKHLPFDIPGSPKPKSEIPVMLAAPRVINQQQPPPPAAASGAPTVLVLKSGKKVSGTGFRENKGYYLTLEGMGEIYFGKNEVASIE